MRISQAMKEEAVMALRDRRGVVKPQKLVDAARDPNHLLHAMFIWDNRKAAEKQRLDTARAIIRSVDVRTVVNSVPVYRRIFVHAPVIPNTPGYETVERVARNPERAAMLLAKAHAGLAAHVERVNDLARQVGLLSEHNAWLLDLLLTQARRSGVRMPHPDAGDGDELHP